MSFERHPTVRAFLVALREQLSKYEEQEALDACSSVDPLSKLLNSTASKGDVDLIDVTSKAIERIKN